jgi:hypothetical protein
MISAESLSIEPARRNRITAITTAVQRRPIVLVLGMHRSGTSLCSHVLSALGVDMADKIPGPGATSAHPSNPRGHWERWEIVEFHDRILSLFNRDYFGRFHDFALPVAWWADPRVAEIRREIAAFLAGRMGDGYFGFKDPRTVRLMPVWHQIFNELKLAPRIVLCLRNPAQVARSLHARDGLDPANGEYRWLVHMIDFFRYESNFDSCTVEYEEWFNNPATNIEKLQKFLDLPWQQSEADLSLVLSGIIYPNARVNDPACREASQPLVRTLWKLAGQVGQDDTARNQIAHIVSQFVSFQQLQTPLVQAFEGVAEVASKYAEIEQEAAALRMQVSERDTELASAQQRADTAEARLADALTEIEGQRAQIADLARERAARAETERELSAIKAALSGREAALKRAEEERAAANLTLEADLGALHEKVAQAERDLQQRVNATQVLEREVRALRTRLDQAEVEATERRTAVAALQTEIAALQGSLSAAREAGKAAVAAFRLDAAVPVPDKPGGRRRGIMRFFEARPSL